MDIQKIYKNLSFLRCNKLQLHLQERRRLLQCRGTVLASSTYVLALPTPGKGIIGPGS